jgi:hypothetical protein
MADPVITRLEHHEYESALQDMGTDYNGFNLVYAPGSTISRRGYVLRLLTDAGLVGEYAGGSAAEYSTLPQIARYLSLELHIDFALAEATDFVRGDVGYDGITGVMKLAHACGTIP